MKTWEHVTKDELGSIVQIILAQLQHEQRKRASTLLLVGDLGAGKTTFTQILAAELGISDHVTSPTYVIEQRYPVPHEAPWKHLVHIDAYRLRGGKEAETLNLTKTLAIPENLVVIEWPEHIRDVLPQSAHLLRFDEESSQNARTLTYEKLGDNTALS